MTSNSPPSPEPPDPPPSPSSPLQSSLPKESCSQSPVPDLDNSVVAFVASDLTQAKSVQLGVATVSLGGSSSVTPFPSSSTSVPLLPLPESNPDYVVTPPVKSTSVLVNSSVTCSGAPQSSVSWVSKVQGPAPLVSSLVSTNTGIPRVRISSEIFKEGAARHREFVALTFLDKAPSMGKIHAFLSYLWGRGKKIEVFSNCFGTIVARIQSDVVRQKILEAQLWHIDGNVFIAQEWSHKFSYSKPSLEAIPIWVRFNNVPCDLITEVGLYQISRALGQPAGVRNLNGFSSGEVLVKIDLSKPLSKFVEVETDEGDVITLEVSYLRVPPICSHCRIIGHRESACSVFKQSSISNVHGNGSTSVEESHVNGPASGPPITEKVVSDSVSTGSDVLGTSIINTVSPNAITIEEPTEEKSPVIATEEKTPTEEKSPDITTEEKTPNETIPIPERSSASDSIGEKKSADEPIPVSDSLSTPDSTTEEELTDVPTPFPDRISAPYSLQYENVTNPSKDKFSETLSLSSRTSAEADVITNSPTNAVISVPFSFGSDVKSDGKPSIFGDLFDKNGVFIDNEWNASPQKSRGGRPLKPSKKMLDSNWSRKRGRGGRGGHGSHFHG